MGEYQNGCYKKTKHAKFSEKRTFLPPDTHTYVCVSGGKKYSFFGKFGELCFLNTCFEIHPFTYVFSVDGMIFNIAIFE